MERRRPFIFIFEGRWFEATFRHQKQGPHGVQIEHRGLHFCQLYGSDSNCPNVTEMIITTFTLNSSNLTQRYIEKELVIKITNDVHVLNVTL